MRRFLISFLIAILVVSESNAQSITKIQLQNLSIITSTPLMPIDGNNDVLITGEQAFSTKFNFDKEINELILGDIKETEYYIYDNQRRPKIYFNGSTLIKYTYENGRLELGQGYSVKNASHNNLGFLADEEFGELLYKRRYKYNDKNQVIEKYTVSQSGIDEKTRISYTYDAKGRIVKAGNIVFEYGNNDDIVLRRDVDNNFTYDKTYKVNYQSGNRFIYGKHNLIIEEQEVERSNVKLAVWLPEENLRDTILLNNSDGTALLLAVGSAFTKMEKKAFYVEPRWIAQTKTFYEYDVNSNGNWTARKAYNNTKAGKALQNISIRKYAVVDELKTMELSAATMTNSSRPIQTPTQTQSVERPRQPDPRAVFPGRTVGSTSTSGSSGTGQGNQGNHAGAPDGSHDGIGSGTSGTSFNLAGRNVIGALPKPAYNSHREGRVIVEITVNAEGSVINAVYRTAGSAGCDNVMITDALNAAKKAKFNPVDSSGNQTGTITYTFKLQ